MDSPEAEQAVGKILKGLPGVHGVRLIERGAWLRYDARRPESRRTDRRIT